MKEECAKNGDHWSIYMDQLKLLDEKVETRLDSKTSAKNDDIEQPDSSCNHSVNTYKVATFKSGN